MGFFIVATLLFAVLGVLSTNQWLKAEKKLSKFGQSKLYNRIKRSELIRKIASMFNDINNQDNQNNSDKQ